MLGREPALIFSLYWERGVASSLERQDMGLLGEIGTAGRERVLPRAWWMQKSRVQGDGRVLVGVVAFRAILAAAGTVAVTYSRPLPAPPSPPQEVGSVDIGMAEPPLGPVPFRKPNLFVPFLGRPRGVDAKCGVS